VHPRLEIETEPLEYLEELVYKLLSQICAAHPHNLQDVAGKKLYVYVLSIISVWLTSTAMISVSASLVFTLLV